MRIGIRNTSLPIRQTALRESLRNATKETSSGSAFDHIPDLELWEGDRYMLDYLISGDTEYFFTQAPLRQIGQADRGPAAPFLSSKSSNRLTKTGPCNYTVIIYINYISVSLAVSPMGTGRNGVDICLLRP